jgi:hypothetical protein
LSLVAAKEDFIKAAKALIGLADQRRHTPDIVMAQQSITLTEGN